MAVCELHNPEPGGMARRLISGWILLFLGSLALYASTANLSIQGRDAGYYIAQALHGSLGHYPSLAVAHPLHHCLAKLALWLNLVPPHYAVTWLSALAAAVTVANTYGCVTTVTSNPRAGLFAALSLTVAHTFWQMATIAEVYTLTTALLSLEVWFVFVFVRNRSWPWLALACLMNAVGIVNHLQAALTTPVIVFLMLYARRRGQLVWLEILLCCSLWLVGTSPFALMILSQMVSTGDIAGTLRSALFGDYMSNALNVGASGRMLLTTALFPLLNFPNLLLPAAVCGLIYMKRLGTPFFARAYVAGGLIVNLLFVARYNVADQYTFYLPVYLFLAILGGWGWTGLSQRLQGRLRVVAAGVAAVLLVATPLFYVGITRAARSRGVLEGYLKDRPNDDKYVRLLVPWSCADRAVDSITRQAVDLASPDGLIITEDIWYHASAIYYFKETQDPGKLEELVVAYATPDRTPEEDEALTYLIRQAVWRRRPVVLVPEVTGRPRIAAVVGRWRPEGDLYVLEP